MKICKQIVNKTKTNIFTVICSRPRVVVPTAQLFKTIVIPRVIPNTNTQSPCELVSSPAVFNKP